MKQLTREGIVAFILGLSIGAAIVACIYATTKDHTPPQLEADHAR